MKKLMLIFLGIFIVGCSPNTDVKNLTHISVVLEWTPNTNYTGLYVALAKKYYEDAGFDVHILQAGKNTPEELISENKAQFGTVSQGAFTFAVLNDMPIISIASLVQHSQNGFYFLKEKGIKTPADFVGKTYGGWGSPVEDAEIRAIMKSNGVVNPHFKTLNIGSMDIRTALSSHVDFMWGFEFWEGMELALSNLKYGFIPASVNNRELDDYDSMLIANKNYIEKNKDLVKRFVQATTKGYEYAISNPQKSAQILLQFAPALSEDLVYKSQKYLSPKYKGNAPYFGMQEEKRFNDTTEWLYNLGVINKKINMKPFFTNEFLQDPKNDKIK